MASRSTAALLARIASLEASALERATKFQAIFGQRRPAASIAPLEREAMEVWRRQGTYEALIDGLCPIEPPTRISISTPIRELSELYMNMCKFKFRKKPQ